MFELEESPDALRVHVVRDRRAAQPDGMLQHLEKRQAQTLEIGPGQTPRRFSRPDARAEQAFVGIDISHSRQQRLVQQRRLDGQRAAAKQLCKFGRVQW